MSSSLLTNLTMLSKTMPKSQIEPALLNSSCGHVTHNDDMNNLTPSPSQETPDLPSWTPLRTLEDDENSSAFDELPTKKATNPATKQRARLPTNAQTTVEDTVTAGRTPKSKSFKRKKARFDGVLITTKLSPYRKFGAQTQPPPAPSSSTRAFSLVDALTRTFDANRHSEDVFPRQPHTALRQYDDASTGPQTDVETTEAEDERLQLNTRLARTPLKRSHTRARFLAASANTSTANSEDVASLVQDIPQPERPVKRLKPIQYEGNPALIDAALETVEAPISWEAEMDIITRDADFVMPAQAVHMAASANVRMAVDGSALAASPPVKGSAPSSDRTPVENEWRMPTWVGPKKPILLPYQSRGAKFRQRLDAIFGANTTVRTDRVARPRPVSSTPHTR